MPQGLVTYRKEYFSDGALETQVLSRIPAVAKSITTQYTLDEMLGIEGDVGRQTITSEIRALLETELSEIYVVLLDARITNIEVDPAYEDKLREKAQTALEQELAVQRTTLKVEELNQEKAQTEIELEKARRDRLVREEQAQVYVNSPELFALEKLRILATAMSSGSVYFVPMDADMSFLIGAEGAVPVE